MTLTKSGIEIMKNNKGLDHLEAVKNKITDVILQYSNVVSKVDAPYLETDIAYDCTVHRRLSPLIRRAGHSVVLVA